MGRHCKWLVLLAGLLAAAGASAHKPSDSYLNLTVDDRKTVSGRWDIALRDLEHVVGLDGNADGAITWGELKTRRGAVFDYALERLRLTVGDDRGCPPRRGELRVTSHSDGSYAVLYFEADCPAAGNNLRISYQLLFEADPSHRGLLQVSGPATTHGRVLSADNRQAEIELGRLALLRQFLSFLRDGIRHLLVGLDHILFLATLLLPAVLVRRDKRWHGRGRTGPAVWEIVKLATAFTVAHSITLSLAVLGIAQLPSQPIEALIALSVVAMAVNNLLPVVHGARWLVAFGFGLVHGFGFASVLTGLGLPPGSLAVALLGFNLGVEVGQLAIIAVAMPLALLLRHTAFYRLMLLQLGSLAIALIGAYWFIQRLLGIS